MFDSKRPDGTTLLPWARGKPIAWDVTVPDTYAESHIGNTATKPGAAAQNTGQNKIDKYSKLASTHIFYPFAIKTAGTWHEMAIELTQEIGRCITTITEDTRETTFLFQRLSMVLQRGNAGLGLAWGSGLEHNAARRACFQLPCSSSVAVGCLSASSTSCAY